ncbi:hypothetical protein LT493_20765 [Streptomyces tricolor]|nr:hypothetical protein [Streptomyces tricolor]
MPNGRAHLGHIAGPLLKMDVLRRHVLRGGGRATMISVSDAHESHVLVRAAPGRRHAGGGREPQPPPHPQRPGGPSTSRTTTCSTRWTRPGRSGTPR